jgi:hypothetical protein
MEKEKDKKGVLGIDSKVPTLKEMILWWEKKRIIYNILIVALSIFSIYSYWDYPMRSIIGNKQIILQAIVFVIGANLGYTISWMSGVVYYYATNKTYISSKRKRWILFILGAIFSLLWTNWFYLILFDVLFAY